MASALLDELKSVATQVKRSQIEYAVGSSWVAPETKKDPQERGIGTLLVEVEVREGWGWGRCEARGGEGAGGRVF